MTKIKEVVLYSFLGVWVLCSVFAPGVAAQEDQRWRARIGLLIRSGDRLIQAKAQDRLAPGDLIRIYVHPEMSSFIYVVHADQKNKKVTLLNMTEQKVHSCMLVLPSVEEYYQVDGNSDMEVFTIICSPAQLHEFDAGETALEYDQWKLLEKNMVERSSLQLVKTMDRPFPIIGNVRSMEALSAGPSIPVFSGRGLLVKRYEFEVGNHKRKVPQP